MQFNLFYLSTAINATAFYRAKTDFTVANKDIFYLGKGFRL